MFLFYSEFLRLKGCQLYFQSRNAVNALLFILLLSNLAPGHNMFAFNRPSPESGFYPTLQTQHPYKPSPPPYLTGSTLLPTRPASLASFSASCLLPKPMAGRPFESNSPDVRQLCFIARFCAADCKKLWLILGLRFK